MIKKIIISIVGLIAILGIIGWLTITFFPDRLIPMMMDQQIQRNLGPTGIFDNKESITVVTVGTASPFPGERAQTGTAVIVNDHFFMFDTGPGVVQKAENNRLPLNELDGIFITHWHSDHYLDLPNLINRSWVLGRNEELHIYGPDGLDTVMYAVDQFLRLENQTRLDHHGPEIMDLSLATAIPHEFHNAAGAKTVVFDEDGIRITAFDVNHEPIEPAVGYAIEYKGKKVVISGDTKKNDLVLEMAQDADLLLHEVLLMSLMQQMSKRLGEIGNTRNEKILHDIQDYHTGPSEVAALAEAAGVKQLVLHHFAPPPDLKVVENLYRQKMKGYSGKIHFANDGDKFVVE